MTTPQEEHYTDSSAVDHAAGIIGMSRPSTLKDALKQDARAFADKLIPKSHKAAERRAEIGNNVRKFGNNVLGVVGVGVLLTASTAIGLKAIDSVLPPEKIGSAVSDQDNEGQGLDSVIQSGLSEISENTGTDVTGADYQVGTTDLTRAGVPAEGFPGLSVEVTAYQSPIFHSTTVDAVPLNAPEQQPDD